MLSFSDLPYDLFIGAEQPEIKMLALLGDLKEADPFDLTEDIVKTIDTLPEPVSTKESRLMQLRILIQLRKFRLDCKFLKAGESSHKSAVYAADLLLGLHHNWS